MALLLLCTFTSQAENDLTTTQITLNIKSGELQSEVESSGWQWNQITNLKLVGELNVDDLQFIRKMVGCYYNRKHFFQLKKQKSERYSPLCYSPMQQ